MNLRTQEPLEPKEKAVIKAYYIDDMTLKEIGKMLGIGSERVRQIKAKALAKIKLGNPKFVQPTIKDILGVDLDKLTKEE